MRQSKDGRPHVLVLDAGCHCVGFHSTLPPVRRTGAVWPPSITKIAQMLSGDCLKILRLEWRAEVRRSVARIPGPMHGDPPPSTPTDFRIHP